MRLSISRLLLVHDDIGMVIFTEPLPKLVLDCWNEADARKIAIRVIPEIPQKFNDPEWGNCTFSVQIASITECSSKKTKHPQKVFYQLKSNAVTAV